MALILSHQTACQYWLSPYAQSAFRPDPKKVHLFAGGSDSLVNSYGESGTKSSISPVFLRKNGKAATEPSNAKLINEFFLPRKDIFCAPYHLLVMSKKLRRRINGTTFHTCSQNIPSNSFYKIATDIYVVSPEYCFVQMASTLTEVQCVKLGMELTAQYCKLPGGGLLYRRPITCVDAIKRFQNSANDIKGIRASRQVIRYITNNSASPRETDLLLLLCLPCRLGGFGLPLPQLNAKIDIPSYFQHLFRKNYYVCDLLWRQNSFAIEYDSDEYHVGTDRIADDSSRRAALSIMGVDAISVTNSQIKSKTEMDNVARLISRKLKRSFRLTKDYDFARRQQELRLEILANARSLGDPKS